MSFFEEYGYPTAIDSRDLSKITSWTTFKKVCDVRSAPGITWDYINIDRDIMYSDHQSWVYFIVVGDTIYKVGESGQPLGIENNKGQPLCQTTNRFGRYRRHGNSYKEDTDEVIRHALKNQVAAGQVSLWAMRCEVVETTFELGGSETTLSATIHKPLEKRILDLILENGYWPRGNKVRG